MSYKVDELKVKEDSLIDLDKEKVWYDDVKYLKVTTSEVNLFVVYQFCRKGAEMMPGYRIWIKSQPTTLFSLQIEFTLFL